MAGLLDFDLTPQTLGLLGAAGAMGQAYAPQPASRLPLAKPNAAYLLSQAAGGLGQGYALGQKLQALQAGTYGQQLGNLQSAGMYNLIASRMGWPTVPMPGAPQPGGAAGSGTGLTLPPSVGPMSPPPAPSGASPVPGAPGMAPGAQTRIAGPPMAAPGSSAPAANSGSPGNMLAQILTNKYFGIALTPAQQALIASGHDPFDATDPVVRNTLSAAAAKTAGVNPVIGGERPGVLPGYYNPATGKYDYDTSALAPMQAGAQAASAGKAAGALPAQEALAGYKRGLELGTSTVNVPLTNGQSRLMTQGDALAMAKGQAPQLTAPPPPMTMKGDETAAPDGSVIPAPPPSMGSRMPGVTVGATTNAAKITEQWTNTIAPTVTAEAYLSQIAQALKQTQSGGLAEVKANVANTLNGLGPAGQALAKQVMAAKDVSNVQTVLHGNILSTLNSLKAIVQGAGGRILKTEFEKVSEEALAHPDLSPQANFNIIAQMMGILRANRSMVSGWTQASSGPAPSGRQWTDPERFESAWYDRNPIAGFEAQAAKEIGPFKGMPGNNGGAIPPDAVKALQMQPNLAPQFDAKYGAGSSAQYLRK